MGELSKRGGGDGFTSTTNHHAYGQNDITNLLQFLVSKKILTSQTFINSFVSSLSSNPPMKPQFGYTVLSTLMQFFLGRRRRRLSTNPTRVRTNNATLVPILSPTFFTLFESFYLFLFLFIFCFTLPIQNHQRIFYQFRHLKIMQRLLGRL